MPDERVMTVDEAVALFEAQLAADGRSMNTRLQYRRHLKTFARWLLQAREIWRIDRVTHADVAAFFSHPASHLTASGRSKKPTSLNALRSSIRTFGRFIHDAGWNDKNPAVLLRRAICGSAPPRALTPDAVERLQTAMANNPSPAAARDRMLVRLLLGAGLRLGEALGLDVRDVEPRDLVLRRTKNGRPAVMPVAPDLWRELAAWIGGRKNGPLFQGRGVRRLTARQAQRRFKGWVECAELPIGVTPHSLRHSFGQRIYEQTADLRLVQTALRHRSIGSAIVYAHSRMSDVRAAIDSMPTR